MSRTKSARSGRPPAARRTPAGTAAARLAQAERLAGGLAALARGLPNPWDESTDYFHGFVAALPASTALGAESLRAALGIGARYQIDLAPAADALARLGVAGSGWSEDVAGGFRQLAQVMGATIRELSLAFARGKGVVRVRVWLFGRTEDGTLVGLRSIGTET
ncbi:MAG TPA: hypothetical protein VK607_17115 [Kofleriaceae bacterium]|nr:hypothetical protein [Kofleriaceae bacterium]